MTNDDDDVHVDLTPASSTAAPAPVAYAPPPPVRERRVARRVRRALVIVAVVLAAVVASRPFWSRAILAFWQNRCLSYVPGDGQVAFDGRTQPTDPTLAWAGYSPPEWVQFDKRLSPKPSRSMGTALLQRMETPGGDVRLIAVDVWVSEVRDPPGPKLIDDPEDTGLPRAYTSLRVRMFEPGTALRLPREISINEIGDGQQIELRQALKVYVGRRSEGDAGHFEIRYEADGSPGVIDGWITGDDTVVMKHRGPP